MEIWLKQKTWPRMNYELNGKTILKKSDPKNRKKNRKNQSEIAACEQKTTSEKANFCSNTIFSLYFKIRARKLASQDHWFFRSTKYILDKINL